MRPEGKYHNMITPDLIDVLSQENYVRRATHRRHYWFDFSKSKLDQFQKKEPFNLIIYSGLESPDKYYVVPFATVREAFTPEYMTKDKLGRKRWVGSIKDHLLKISNYPKAINISHFYSAGFTDNLIGKKGPSLRVVTEPVKNWNSVVDNLREFSLIKNLEPSYTLDNFSAFSNWYYFPEDDLFAPGKFIGYQNSSIPNYSGLGDGAQAKNIMSKYFTRLNKNADLFLDLKAKLVLFASGIGKKINSLTFSGKGGIFVPIDEYLNRNSTYSQNIFDVSKADIDSFSYEHEKAFEGERKERLVSYYERDAKLRATAIQIHGTKCQVCEFDFKANYGDHGENYIEVHHKTALHSLLEASEIDPEQDMAVLCANCHRMIHRKKYSPLSIEDLRSIWNKVN